MIRRAFRVAVAGACLLSLLLCVGAGWLWVRSYRLGGGYDWRGADIVKLDWQRSDVWRETSIWSSGGTVRVQHQADPIGPKHRGFSAFWGSTAPRDMRIHAYNYTPDTSLRVYEVGGYGASWASRRSIGQFALVIALPWWLLFLASGFLPLLWLGAAGRRRLTVCRRRKHGWCPACGYNLTGNVSGKCPECGAARDIDHFASVSRPR